MSSEEKEQKRITRREFVKGAAVGAAGVAAAGALASCTTAATPQVIKETVEVPVEVIKEVEVNPLIPQKWDYEADVVVVGLGAAGASAAISAHDNGAKVLVVEKQSYGVGAPPAVGSFPSGAGYTHYSNSRACGGVFHNPHPDGDRNAMFEYVLAMFSGENCPWKLEGEQPHVSREIVEMYVDEIYKNADWLYSIDPDLDPTAWQPTGEASFPMFPGFEAAKYGKTIECRYKDAIAQGTSYSNNLRVMPKTWKSSGEALMWALVEVGMRNRGIDETEGILYGTPGKRLVQSVNGEIIGVIAEREGKEIACKARKAVILTAGGFEFSIPMRRAFLEGPGIKGWTYYGSQDNTGDGIEMAIKVGAALAKVGKQASRIEVGIPYGPAWDEKGLRQGFHSSGNRPNSVIVDNWGKRYANENIVYDSSLPYRYQFYKEAVKYNLLKMTYDRSPSWLVFDETLRQGRPAFYGYATKAGWIPWTEDNMDAINRGWIIKADSIAELAAAILADPENRNMMDAATLAETVSNFNGYCAAGNVDLEFERKPATMGPVETPPFYAIKLYPGGPNTKGGIDADATRHVLDWEGKQMPRFYTAGEISSVFKFTYQAGGNITECMVCGRVAGRNAAKETPWS